jgi:DNA-binding CsgD family transcriptional regulator
MQHRRTAEEVEQLLKGYEESGLSREAYCRREGIRLSTLDYYRQRDTRKAAAKRRAAAARMVEVQVQPAAPESQPGFTLLLANGRRIESAWTFNDTDLARLIRVIEAA